MLVALTVRNLRPGSYEQFRKAWEPEDWPEQWERAYHIRNVNDENEVISFGFFSGGPEEMEKFRDSVDFMEAEDARLRRIAPFEEATRFGGVFEVIEEIIPPGR
jgi:hypothetical protein